MTDAKEDCSSCKGTGEDPGRRRDRYGEIKDCEDCKGTGTSS